ncbi:hypothetical protein GCM10029976_059930 [Kribbella albertanoniae]|uniref:Uncharacterized protein n=1 Tax=Kribbella albertanoniae TaxID=1266829 RepID=A0A4R4QGP4_9ACTN|nr:hypothetical protein [Kribbella albertanoniae]TDC34871.1 hypothetical protein E1261_02935 [Kribbella albertanoniae]
MRARVIAAVLVAPLIGLALTAPAAQATPDPDLTVTAARIIRTTPVAVSSLNLVPVTVEVDAQYTEPDAGPDTMLNANLERTGGSGPLTYLIATPLTRYEGTTQNGKWRGTVLVPSTADGKFELAGVMVGPWSSISNGGMTSPTPVPSPRPTLTVVGTNVPKITARVIPDPVPYGQGYSIRWSVINGQTGKPYGTRLKVWLRNDNGCAEAFGGPVDLTDTNGYVTKAYPASLTDYLNCLQLPGGPIPLAGFGFFVNRLPRAVVVSATPSRTSAPVGTIVPVNGTVSGSPSYCPVNLQRLYGATAWRTVGTAKVRLSGRYTVNAQPAYKGNIPYRVSFPACTNFKAGVSRTFTIKGV